MVMAVPLMDARTPEPMLAWMRNAPLKNPFAPSTTKVYLFWSFLFENLLCNWIDLEWNLNVVWKSQFTFVKAGGFNTQAFYGFADLSAAE
jgi:hypothetical protein